MLYILLIFILARELFQAVFTHGIKSEGLQKWHFCSFRTIFAYISPGT